MSKILTVKEAIGLSTDLQKQGKTIALVGGCFDILHVGHIRFLQKAKMEGDILIVMLESDANIKKYKGPGRPIHTQADRAEILSALSPVDAVILLPELRNDHAYDEMILALKPAIIATTIGDPNRSHKVRQAKLIQGEVVDVTERVTDASTSRLARLLSKEL
jgi:FAD synthetase